MSFLKENDFKKIAQILNAKHKVEGDHHRFSLVNPEDSERRLSLEIYDHEKNKNESFIIVFTPNCHLQLHHCNQIAFEEMMGEVTFISEEQDSVSALVVEETGGCSFYSQIDRSTLSGDYKQIGVEVMLAGAAHSLNPVDDNLL